MDESDVHDFERTVLVHIEAVYRLALRLCRNVEAAEDLAQEAMLQAWRSFHRFDRGVSARPWLYGIVFHVSQNDRRRRGRDPVVADSAAANVDLVIYDPPTPATLTDEEILAAFDAIPTHLSAIVLLADLEDLSYREIATGLDIPIGTVMSRLSRGRKLLRRELAAFAERHGMTPRTVDLDKARSRSG